MRHVFGIEHSGNGQPENTLGDQYFFYWEILKRVFFKMNDDMNKKADKYQLAVKPVERQGDQKKC